MPKPNTPTGNNSSGHGLLFTLGTLSGCHQRPDRSFFFRGKQFPVCARCTGCFVGYVGGLILGCFYLLPWYICLALCAVMLLDWLIQRLGLRESTNLRRLLTGIACGLGYMQLFLLGLAWLCRTLVGLL